MFWTDNLNFLFAALYTAVQYTRGEDPCLCTKKEQKNKLTVNPLFSSSLTSFFLKGTNISHYVKQDLGEGGYASIVLDRLLTGGHSQSQERLQWLHLAILWRCSYTQHRLGGNQEVSRPNEKGKGPTEKVKHYHHFQSFLSKLYMLRRHQWFRYI